MHSIRTMAVGASASCSLVPGGENCDMSTYNTGDVVQVTTGGSTRCMESSAPYSFAFRKGVSNKLLIYFVSQALAVANV